MNKTKLPTQAELAFEYMERTGGISRPEAMYYLGIADLPGTIRDLRKFYGINVEAERVKITNRYGRRVSYNVYRIGEDYGNTKLGNKI